MTHWYPIVNPTPNFTILNTFLNVLLNWEDKFDKWLGKLTPLIYSLLDKSIAMAEKGKTKNNLAKIMYTCGRF